VETSRIAAFSVLADLPAAELDELAAAMGEVDVEAGAKVITLDDYGTAVYFIERGEADVLTDGGEATEALGHGDTLGEIALLLTGQRTATVVARTRCGSSHFPVRTSSASERVYLSSNPRCAASALSARVGRRI
jgi:signal-transduction protein with cAMP-binding, CBS, and nucleotidyltransferase domain